jgi:hypothetical protein
MSSETKNGRVKCQDVMIANPIYDTVFKNLMENERVARFFVSTLLGETIDEISMRPQEVTVKSHAGIKAKADKITHPASELLGMTVLHYDFIATIKTASGERKKVLIEVQKGKEAGDLMRFRRYLAEQYKRRDTVEVQGIKRREILPIITVYVLGFPLPEIETAAFHVQREYWDMINDRPIRVKNSFVENLTHDSYIVQIPRIEGRTQTKLERLLSLFEQDNFIDEYQIVKTYGHAVEEEEIDEMLGILNHAGADPEQRKLIESEQELLRVLDVMSKREEYEVNVQIMERDKKELVNTIAQKDAALVEKEVTIAREREEKEAAIAREREEKEAAIAEKEAAISREREEKEAAIARERALLDELEALKADTKRK